MTSPRILNMNWTMARMEIARDQATTAESDAVCQQIADILTPAEYAEWWNSTPDGNSEFLAAARMKLAELQTMKHTPRDYTACLNEEPADPTAAECASVNEWLRDNWDDIPEVEF